MIFFSFSMKFSIFRYDCINLSFELFGYEIFGIYYEVLIKGFHYIQNQCLYLLIVISFLLHLFFGKVVLINDVEYWR